MLKIAIYRLFSDKKKIEQYIKEDNDSRCNKTFPFQSKSEF